MNYMLKNILFNYLQDDHDLTKQYIGNYIDPY